MTASPPNDLAMIVVHLVAADEHRRPSPAPVPEQGVPFRNRSELTRHSPSTYMPPRHHDPLDTGCDPVLCRLMQPPAVRQVEEGRVVNVGDRRQSARS